MAHTFKDSPHSRKNREENFGSKKKEKRLKRSRIKQKIRHDTQSIDEDYYNEEWDWIDDQYDDYY